LEEITLKSMAHPSLIRLENITLRIRDRFILSDTSWDLKKGQNWVILGPNGAGKSSIVRALIGELPIVKGKIIFPDDDCLPDKIACVSFERHQGLIEREDHLDAARYFSGEIDRFTTVRQILLSDLPAAEIRQAMVTQIVDQLQIKHLLTRAIRFLSTGEMRKVLIARALLRSPRLLILDEPFDGLDLQTRTQMADCINTLMNGKQQVILVTHRITEVLPNISHILGIKEGKVLFQGERERMLTSGQIERLYAPEKAPAESPLPPPQPAVSELDSISDVLIEVRATTVKYGDVTILENLNWKMNAGENWAILGLNGAGKTTLLSLIAGDNPQAYANEIYLFGKRRGSGESIWDIKKRIGIVSAEFQIRYRKPITAAEVVLSGFFDSVGLYHHSTHAQKEIAQQWIEVFQVGHLAERQFFRLSYGEQRMVLLARAMVKFPVLLILDEPCQGLDRNNRQKILNLIEYIGRHGRTDLLFVTHHAEEIPDCITHILRLGRTPAGQFTAVQEHR
jgi:molybdate transport system ATP-binding protein